MLLTDMLNNDIIEFNLLLEGGEMERHSGCLNSHSGLTTKLAFMQY